MEEDTELKDEKCCVCGKPAIKWMQYYGGEREYPKIYYCKDHGEYNDDFNKRSTS